MRKHILSQYSVTRINQFEYFSNLPFEERLEIIKNKDPKGFNEFCELFVQAFKPEEPEYHLPSIKMV